MSKENIGKQIDKAYQAGKQESLQELKDKVMEIDENQFPTPTDVKRRTLSLIADIIYD